jgi:hypothetical protein
MAKHTITLTAEEVEYYLKNALHSKFGKTEMTIKPILSQKSECIDPYRNDYVTYPHFNGVEISWDE